METIVSVLGPLLTVVVFARSKRHFTLLERINGRTKLILRYPPLKGKGSLPWISLPLSTMVLGGYVLRVLAWLEVHPLIIVLTLVVCALVAAVWHWRSAIVTLVIRATPPEEPALRRARDEWQNSLLPDHMNND